MLDIFNCYLQPLERAQTLPADDRSCVNPPGSSYWTLLPISPVAFQTTSERLAFHMWLRYLRNQADGCRIEPGGSVRTVKQRLQMLIERVVVYGSKHQVYPKYTYSWNIFFPSFVSIAPYVVAQFHSM